MAVLAVLPDHAVAIRQRGTGEMNWMQWCCVVVAFIGIALTLLMLWCCLIVAGRYDDEAKQ